VGATQPNDNYRVKLDIESRKEVNAEWIKDEIRKLNRTDKIEICRWLDEEAASDLRARIGVPRNRTESAG
jgi:hypothetical protein